MTDYMLRESYMEKLRRGRGATGIIKIITGMRRCGKSVLLRMYREELLSTGVSEDDILFIDFEDFDNQNIRTKDDLNNVLRDRVRTGRTVYVLLDEIQNVEGWEMSLSALNAEGNCDVYVTGSNSDMLSSRLATHISGRHVEIRVYPLSFREFVRFHGYTDNERALSDYMEMGGLPAIETSWDRRFICDYLESVYNTIVVKDVVRNAGVKDPSKIVSISRFLYSCIGSITSCRTVSRGTGLSESTVAAYMNALSEAFLVLPCDRYDMVGRKILSTNRKYYVPDLGMRRAVLNMTVGTDISRPLENLVYVELLRRGYHARSGSYNDLEVDFIAERDGTLEYYQVCQTMMSDGTRERETRSLLKPDDNHPKIILTLDRFGLGNERGIQIRNIIDWLMEE